jgi:hypothetical protein
MFGWRSAESPRGRASNGDGVPAVAPRFSTRGTLGCANVGAADSAGRLNRGVSTRGVLDGDGPACGIERGASAGRLNRGVSTRGVLDGDGPVCGTERGASAGRLNRGVSTRGDDSPRDDERPPSGGRYARVSVRSGEVICGRGALTCGATREGDGDAIRGDGAARVGEGVAIRGEGDGDEIRGDGAARDGKGDAARGVAPAASLREELARGTAGRDSEPRDAPARIFAAASESRPREGAAIADVTATANAMKPTNSGERRSSEIMALFP